MGAALPPALPAEPEPEADPSQVPDVPLVRFMRRTEANRSRRLRSIGPRTLGARQMWRGETELGRLLHPPVEVERPTTRADCADGPRPCPFVSCRYHLYLEVTDTGSIKFVFPDLEPDELEHSCALDVADEGGVTLERTGDLLNVTRERTRQIEMSAMAKAKRRLARLREP